MAHVPVGWAGRLGRSPGASGVHGAEAAPGPPGAHLPAAWAEDPADSVPGRRGTPCAGNSDELAALSPPGTPGTAATHHGYRFRSTFSGHCTGLSMSTHRTIRGPCTAPRWQLRPRPASRAPTYLRLGPKLQLTACPADGALPTQAIPTNWLLPPRPAHRAPRLPTTDATAAVHSPVIVPACRCPLIAPSVAPARLAGGSCGRARPTGHRGYPPRIPLPQSILRSLYRPVDVHSPRHTWPLHGSQMAAAAAPGPPGAFLPAAWAEGPADSVPGRRGTPYAGISTELPALSPPGPPGTVAVRQAPPRHPAGVQASSAPPGPPPGPSLPSPHPSPLSFPASFSASLRRPPL